MALIENVIEGTLKADGTLVIDEKPKLSAGRVMVVLRQQAELKSPPPPGEEFLQMIAEIRSDQRARGHTPRDPNDVSEQRRILLEEVEDEVEAAIQLQEECRRRRKQSESESTAS